MFFTAFEFLVVLNKYTNYDLTSLVIMFPFICLIMIIMIILTNFSEKHKLSKLKCPHCGLYFLEKEREK